MRNRNHNKRKHQISYVERKYKTNFVAGEAYRLESIIVSDGVHYINTTACPVKATDDPPGTSLEIIVRANGEDKHRDTRPGDHPAMIQHEIRVGDFIYFYDYTKDRLRIRQFEIWNIKNNNVGVIAVRESIIPILRVGS